MPRAEFYKMPPEQKYEYIKRECRKWMAWDGDVEIDIDEIWECIGDYLGEYYANADDSMWVSREEVVRLANELLFPGTPAPEINSYFDELICGILMASERQTARRLGRMIGIDNSVVDALDRAIYEDKKLPDYLTEALLRFVNEKGQS